MRRMNVGTCDRCGKDFEYYLIHNGFNDTQYAYCDSCGRTTLLDVYFKDVPEGIWLAPGFIIDSMMEALLEDCECGGRFLAGASPRCPHCHAKLSAIAATEYIERDAPGTRKGARWQRNWVGLYCIIIGDNVVCNNWRKED